MNNKEAKAIVELYDEDFGILPETSDNEKYFTDSVDKQNKTAYVGKNYLDATIKKELDILTMNEKNLELERIIISSELFKKLKEIVTDEEKLTNILKEETVVSIESDHQFEPFKTYTIDLD